MIKVTDELFEKLVGTSTVKRTHDHVKEQVHQAKISKDLEKRGFVIIKLIVANTSGWPDLLAIHKDGQAWGIEVKRPEGEMSVLQYHKLVLLHKNNTVCMCAYGFEDYKNKMDYLVSLRKQS